MSTTSGTNTADALSATISDILQRHFGRGDDLAAGDLADATRDILTAVRASRLMDATRPGPATSTICVKCRGRGHWYGQHSGGLIVCAACQGRGYQPS